MNVKFLNRNEEPIDAVKVIGSYTEETHEDVTTRFTSINSEDKKTYENQLKNVTSEGQTAINFDGGKVTVRESLDGEKILFRLGEARKLFPNMTLGQFLEKAGYLFTDGSALTLDKLYAWYGKNTACNTLADFAADINTSPYTSSRWLVPEIIREMINKGLVEEGIYNNLIVGSRSVSQPTETVPHMNYSGEQASMEEVGEAENLPLGKVSFGSKQVKITKRGLAIRITDEVRRYIVIDMLARYFADVRRRLDNDRTSRAIETLINGDLPNSTDPIENMGVASTSNKIQYVDYLKMGIRASRAGLSFGNFICNETEANRILNQDDFKPSSNSAAPRFQINLANSGVLSGANLWVHDDIPDHKQLWIDPSIALERLEAEPLAVEQSRVASEGADFYYIRNVDGFANLRQEGKVMLDGTQLFSSTDYPTYWELQK